MHARSSCKYLNSFTIDGTIELHLPLEYLNKWKLLCYFFFIVTQTFGEVSVFSGVTFKKLFDCYSPTTQKNINGFFFY